MPSKDPAPVGTGPVFWTGVGERCLMAALLVTPIYFTVFSERVFEAEKAGLLRWLATCALAALLAEGLRLRGTRPSRAPLRLPLSLRPKPKAKPRPRPRPKASAIPMAMALLLSTSAISTLGSVAPATSLMGAYTRGQGLVTLMAFMIFAIVASRVARGAGGLRRLALIIALSGFAPAIYGLLQSFGLDPLPWEGDVVTRVVGSAGNSVMLAAHLTLCLPFAIGELLEAWRATHERSALHGGTVLAGWLLVCLVESLAIVLAGSRGPILGLLAGLFLLLLAVARVRSQRRVAMGAMGAAGLALLLLLGLNFASGPLEPLLAPLREMPLLDRFSTALDPERSTTRVRLRLWEGSSAALEANPGRWIFGFGPETMDRIWAPYYPPILAYDEPRGYLPDRAHNLVLDALLSVGVLGLAAMLGLFWLTIASLLRVMMRPAEPARPNPSRPRIGPSSTGVLFALGSGLIAALLMPVLDEGWRLSGLALGLGCLAGLSLWLVGSVLRATRPESPTAAHRQLDAGTMPLAGSAVESNLDGDGRARERRTGESRAGARRTGPVTRRFAAAALVAGVSHFVELQVGFQLVGSGLLFWVLVGATWGMWDGRVTGAIRSASSAEGDAGAGEGSDDVLDADLALFAAFLVGATLTFSLARPGLVAGGVGAVLFLVVSTSLVVGFLSQNMNVGPGARGWAGAVMSALFGAHRRGLALWLGAYALWHLWLLSRLGAYPDDALSVMAADLLVFALALLTTVWFSAERAARVDPSHGRIKSRPALVGGRRLPGLLLLLVLAGCGARLFLAPTMADAAYKEGLRAWQAEVGGLRGEGESGKAESFLKRAVERYATARRIVPWEPAYRLASARAELEWADLLDARLSRRLAAVGRSDAVDEYDPALLGGETKLLAEARDAHVEAALGHAREAEPWMASSPLPLLARARSLRVWGDRTRSEALRSQRFNEARAAYLEASALAPGWPEVLDEAALTALLADDPTRAVALAREAIERDPFFRRAWRTSAEAHLALGDPAAATLAYGEYFVDYRNRSDLPALKGWMEALAADGQLDEALLLAREIQRLQPADAGALADLAQLLQAQGDRSAAREAAEAAGDLAPEDTAIRRLIEELSGSNENG